MSIPNNKLSVDTCTDKCQNVCIRKLNSTKK